MSCTNNKQIFKNFNLLVCLVNIALVQDFKNITSFCNFFFFGQCPFSSYYMTNEKFVIKNAKTAPLLVVICSFI